MMPRVAGQLVMHALFQLPDLTLTHRCVTLALSLPFSSDLSNLQVLLPGLFVKSVA